jgi:hypothetical protein
MSCAIDGHQCKHCGKCWGDEDHAIPCSHDYGCTEWHTCRCDDVIDTDEESRVDYPFTVGRPDVFGGSCYRTIEEAKANARNLSTLGQCVAVKTCDDDGRPTVIAHLYENGQEIQEAR